MRIAGFIDNDMVDGEGVCVSVWMQGCPHKCKGCHNPETWSFTGGMEYDDFTIYNKLGKALNANGVKRNFSLLGGEPLCKPNVLASNKLGNFVKNNFPDRKIFLWTGYTIDDLVRMGPPYTYCFMWADTIIDGKYQEELRDVTLKLRGSSNQRVINILHVHDDKMMQNILCLDETGDVLYVDTHS